MRAHFVPFTLALSILVLAAPAAAIEPVDCSSSSAVCVEVRDHQLHDHEELGLVVHDGNHAWIN